MKKVSKLLPLPVMLLVMSAGLQAQDVGIGTTTPLARLHIKTNLEAASILESSSLYGSWLYINNTSTGGKSWALVSTGQNNGEGAGNLLFRDNGSNAVRMTINSGTGNVRIGASLNVGTFLGIGTTTPPAKLTVLGTYSNPSIPDTTSTGIFRIGVSGFEGIDFGKMGLPTYAGWIQSGINGLVADPLSLQPLGGDVGIGTTEPGGRLHIKTNRETVSILESASWTGSWLYINNTSPGGKSWAIVSSGQGSGEGAGNLLFRDNGSSSVRMMIHSGTGNVGIGITAPNTRLHVMGGTDAEYNIPTSGYIVSGNVYGANIVMDDNEIMARNNSSTSTLYLQNDGGSLETGGQAYKPGGGMWIASSDARLKKDIHSFSDGLEILKQINPVWFSYNGKAGIKDTNAYVGIIAQEMQKIAPYMISEKPYTTENGTKENYLAYDGNALLYILVNGVKEQQAHITSQDTQIAELKKQIAELKLLITGK